MAAVMIRLQAYRLFLNEYCPPPIIFNFLDFWRGGENAANMDAPPLKSPDPDKSCQLWFQSQIWFKRLVLAVALSVAFSAKTFFVSTVFLSASTSSLNPWTWLIDALSVCFCMKTLLLAFLSLFLFASACCLFWKVITIYPRSFRNCLSKEGPFLLVWDLGLNLGFLAVSLVTSYYVLEASASTFKHQTHNLPTGQNNVSVGHSLIVISILIANIWSTIDYFKTSAYMIRFTSITRPPFYAFKSDFPFLLKECFWRTLYALGVAVLCLPIIGLRFVGWLVAPDADIPSILSIFWGLCDVRLFVTAFILVFRNQLVLVITQKWFHWILNQPVVFPIPPPHHNLSFMDSLTSTPYLPAALESKYDIILKYFAFWDLSRLSQECQGRRAQIFSVSLPGGHPRNWNSVFGSCSNQLTKLKEEIEKQNGRLCGTVDMGYARVSKPDMETMLQPKHISLLDKPGLRDRKPQFRNPNFSAAPIPQQKHSVINFLAKVRFFGQKDPGKLPSSAAVFQDSQMLVWAVEAVSFLVYWSYEEDKLGIVQKDLSTAFGLILDLQSAVERFCRLSGMHHQFFPGLSNQNSKYLESLVIGLRQALHSAVYRIRERFQAHLDSIPLSNNQRIWLNSQHF